MDVMSDDALGLVLERVGSHVSLIRAAAVCKRWRRAIADAAFLRRFHSLHAPPVAGYFQNDSTARGSAMGVEAKTRRGLVFVPSSPPVVGARHFSLDFLPNGAGSWAVQDSRGSLLLMDRAAIRAGATRWSPHCQTSMRVAASWEPSSSMATLTRRAVASACPTSGCYTWCSVALPGKPLYSPWVNRAPHHGVRTEKSVDYNATGPQFMYLLGYAGGSWYFYMEDRTLIILDGSTGEFSCSQLPITVTQDLNMSLYNFRITEGRDSKPRFFTTFCDSIKVFMRLCSGDWVLEKRVMLSEATRSLLGYRTSFFSHPPNILTLGVGFIILSPVCEMWWPFSVDLETMEASPAAGDMGIMVYRCELPWPPALPAMCHAMRNEALHQKVDRHW